MTITATIALLTSIFKAIPALKGWWDQLVAVYVAKKYLSMEKDHREAIKFAIVNHDQRKVENEIGSGKAGELSGVPGTVIVDTLPNVGMREQEKNRSIHLVE